MNGDPRVGLVLLMAGLRCAGASSESGRISVSDLRRLAGEKGRPFVGYVEQCTAAYYDKDGVTLHRHTREQMGLAKARGATDVYVHVIRAGSLAWYHSDVVQRCMPKPGEAKDGWVNVGKWLAQGDPMAVAIEEARSAELRVFADMGMNVTYITQDPNYKGLGERFALAHPEYRVPGRSMFLDYRHKAVRDYVVAIARELITKYDVDGINLDFARFGNNKAFDEASLVAVVGRIHEARKSVEATRGRPVTIATRIPSYLYATDAAWSQNSYGGEHPWFTAALKTWAANGWIDRVMVCCPLPGNQKKLSLARYKAAISGSAVRFWGDLYVPGKRSAEEIVETARRWVKQGVDGGFFFYTVSRPEHLPHIDWRLRLVDHPEATATVTGE